LAQVEEEERKANEQNLLTVVREIDAF